MTTPDRHIGERHLEDRALGIAFLAVALAFAWILWPFGGAILWAVAIAIVFAPLHRRLLLATSQRQTLAALATLAIILVLVILPVTLIIVALVNEATDLYTRVDSGALNLGQYVQQVVDALPRWVVSLLHRVGVTDLPTLEAKLAALLRGATQFLAGHALTLGASTLSFAVSVVVMLYLLFFLLRDGEALAVRVTDAIPLRPELRHSLVIRFTTAVRATIKGSLIVAAVQGFLGGLTFWLVGIGAPVLWGLVMALLALLTPMGSVVLWLPIAVYSLATGSTGRGIVLLVYGVLVIGVVDYVLRPLLVGEDTKIPGYLVLLSTLGGIGVLGINGILVGPVIAAIFLAVWAVLPAAKAHSS